MEPQTLPFLRVDHDLFHVVRRHFAFGDDGEVLLQLSVDQLRAVIDVVRPQKPGGGVH
jgi:hypothetical protein